MFCFLREIEDERYSVKVTFHNSQVIYYLPKIINLVNQKIQKAVNSSKIFLQLFFFLFCFFTYASLCLSFSFSFFFVWFCVFIKEKEHMRGVPLCFNFSPLSFLLILLLLCCSRAQGLLIFFLKFNSIFKNVSR